MQKNLKFFELYNYWHSDLEFIQDKSADEFTVNLGAPQRFPTMCFRGIDGTWTGAVDVSSDGFLCVDDLEAISIANDMCNRAGADTISIGSYIGFIIECYESSLLTEEQIGMIPHFGDRETLIFLTDKLLKNEGIGKLFTKGIRGAAEQIGGDAKDLTVEVKNLDLPAHDPRAVYGNFVNYATSPRGACHERGDCQAIATGLVYPEVGLEEVPDRFSVDQAADLAIVAQDASMMYNCSTICKFMVKFAGMTITEYLKGLETVTGEKWSGKDLFLFGERSLNLQRLLNVRDGMSRKDDTVPKKMFIPAAVGGRAGKAPTEAEFNQMLDEYYEKRGWTKDGIPTAEKLNELGLGEYTKYIPQ